MPPRRDRRCSSSAPGRPVPAGAASAGRRSTTCVGLARARLRRLLRRGLRGAALRPAAERRASEDCELRRVASSPTSWGASASRTAGPTCDVVRDETATASSRERLDALYREADGAREPLRRDRRCATSTARARGSSTSRPIRSTSRSASPTASESSLGFLESARRTSSPTARTSARPTARCPLERFAWKHDAAAGRPRSAGTAPPDPPARVLHDRATWENKGKDISFGGRDVPLVEARELPPLARPAAAHPPAASSWRWSPGRRGRRATARAAGLDLVDPRPSVARPRRLPSATSTARAASSRWPRTSTCGRGAAGSATAASATWRRASRS